MSQKFKSNVVPSTLASIGADRGNISKLNSDQVTTGNLVLTGDGQQTLTVGSVQYPTIQSAIDALQGLHARETTIVIPAGEYQENLKLDQFVSSTRLGYNETNPLSRGLLIQGDTRVIAGATFLSGGRNELYSNCIYDNDAAPTQVVGYTPDLGTRHGLVTLTNNGTNGCTVTMSLPPVVDPDEFVGLPGSVVQPNFVSLGAVAGDKLMIHDSAGANYVRNITSVSGNSVFFDGAAVTFDTEGSSITFVPNVTVLNPSTSVETCVISGASLTIKGVNFQVGSNGVQVRSNVVLMGSCTVQIPNCVFSDPSSNTLWNLDILGGACVQGSDRSGATQVLSAALTGLSEPYVYNDPQYNGWHTITVFGGGNASSGFEGGGCVRNLGGQIADGSWYMVCNNGAGWGFMAQNVSGKQAFHGMQINGAAGGFGMLCTGCALISVRTFNIIKCFLGVSLLGCWLLIGFSGWLLSGFGGGRGIEGNGGSLVHLGSDFIYDQPTRVRNYGIGLSARDGSIFAFRSPQNQLVFDTVTDATNTTGQSKMILDETDFAPNGVLVNTANAALQEAVLNQRIGSGAPVTITLDPTVSIRGTPNYVGKRFALYASTAQAHILSLSSGAFFGGAANGLTTATFGGAIGDGLLFEVVSTTEVQVLASTNVAFS